jgi:hypothetical protein
MKDEMKYKIVKKGERFALPINGAGFQWISVEAENNGVVISLGPTGEFGVFINETKWREIAKEFEEKVKED